MESITFDLEKAKIIEDAVCMEFGCSIYEIVCFKNTFFKKVISIYFAKNEIDQDLYNGKLN